MYMMLRVHILSKKVTYIKLKVIGCSPHPIHEYFKVTTLLLTLVPLPTSCDFSALTESNIGHIT